MTVQPTAAVPDDKVLDISNYRPSRQEANKLDLERRLAAGPAPDAITPSPRVMDNAMDAPKHGLMGSLFPYIAAAFFFAIIGAGAIFYFVAIRLPERVTQDGLQMASGPSPYGDGNQNSILNRERAGVEPRQNSTGLKSAGQVRPIEIAPPVEIPSSIPAPAAGLSVANVAGFDGGPPSNSFASAAMANLRPAVKPQAQNGPEGDAPPAASKPDNDPAARIQGAAAANAVTSAPAPVPEAPAVKPVEQASKPEEAKADAPQATNNAQPSQAPVRSASLTPAEPSKSSPKPARATKAISSDLETEYLARGNETLRGGDVAEARLLFQYLVDQGSAAGAYAMGQTYDPALLASLGVRGMKGNSKTARTWYEKAASMGNDEALAKVKGAAR